MTHTQHATRVAQRLFLALWPDDGVRAELSDVSQQLKLDGGRLIAPHNLHVTLIFLGMVDPPRRACIEQAVPRVGGPFEFALNRLESRRRGGIVWLTADDVPAALQELVASLNTALMPCGHAAETRPYRLHVTLARGARRVEGEPRFAPIVWRTRDFCLVSSRVGRGGSEYTVEQRWPLA